MKRSSRQRRSLTKAVAGVIAPAGGEGVLSPQTRAGLNTRPIDVYLIPSLRFLLPVACCLFFRSRQCTETPCDPALPRPCPPMQRRYPPLRLNHRGRTGVLTRWGATCIQPAQSVAQAPCRTLRFLNGLDTPISKTCRIRPLHQTSTKMPR